MASYSLASEHFPVFGELSARDPRPLPAQRVSSWDTRLDVKGWAIDTADVTISLPSAKSVKLRNLLRQWPADRFLAAAKEVRARWGHRCVFARWHRLERFAYVAYSTVRPSSNRDMAG